MNDVLRTADDLLQELLLVDESHRIEAKRCTQVAYRTINRTDTLNASTRLRDLNLLAMKGSGSRTYYVPAAAFEARQSLAEVEAMDGRRVNGQIGTTSADNSHQSPLNSHHLLVTIPADLRGRLPDAGTKPRREVLRRLIEDLCAWRPLSARELAGILGRQEHKPLVRDYLSPMVAEGRLAYTISKMENHPEQRYTTPMAPEIQKP